MPVGREAAHIVADLRHDDPGAEVTDPRACNQDGNFRAKGLDIGVDPSRSISEMAASMASTCWRCSCSRKR